MLKTTTIEGLQELQDTPQVLNYSEEPLNFTSLENATNSSDNSIPFSHFRCGCNNDSVESMSSNRVFVLSESGKPLTPCKSSKARKLLEGGVARPIWNKFGLFGIQMLIQTRKHTPKTVLGIDNGTKLGRENYLTFNGFETKELREKKELKKSSNKSAEHFYSHCVDSFVIASVIANNPIHTDGILIVDDTYRPTRRRLHDTQFKKGGIREKYSAGNFKGTRKGTICEFGQIVGGTKNNFWIRNLENKRVGKVLTKISWLSHKFKVAIHPPIEIGGLLATEGVL